SPAALLPLARSLLLSSTGDAVKYHRPTDNKYLKAHLFLAAAHRYEYLRLAWDDQRAVEYPWFQSHTKKYCLSHLTPLFLNAFSDTSNVITVDNVNLLSRNTRLLAFLDDLTFLRLRL